jgi:radical SAM superfamily enzyme YgiQ (UPF0313 family)
VKILLVSANSERIKMTSLPLGLLLVTAAVRQAGHKVTFLDLLGKADPKAAIHDVIETSAPEVIGLSVRNIDDQNMLAPQFLLDRIREVVAACRAASRAPIVLGGAGYSMFPEVALDYLEADFGICGEGEIAFPLLLERLKHGESVADVPGLYVAGSGLQAVRCYEPELDRLPLPSEDLWSAFDPSDLELWIPVQTRRGCPMDCSYCSTANIEGCKVRFRSPQHIVEHLAQAAAAGFRQFYFVDNTFNLPASYALDLCHAISAARLGITWRASGASSRADVKAKRT